MNSKSQGEKSVGAVASRLLKHGIVTLLPLSDNQRYDLVIERDRFETVQCKTGKLSKDGACIVFNTCSSHFKTYKRTSYKGQVDLFGVYCPQTDGVYLVPVGKMGTVEGLLRLTPQRKKNRVANWAKDYELA